MESHHRPKFLQIAIALLSQFDNPRRKEITFYWFYQYQKRHRLSCRWFGALFFINYVVKIQIYMILTSLCLSTPII